MKSRILSCRLFDRSQIIDAPNEAAGFPVTNLQDIQPTRPWMAVNFPSPMYFIVDLLQNAGTNREYIPTYDTAALLFHNGRASLDTWRIRTGLTTTGVGRYDSGTVSLWEMDGDATPGSERNPLFYERGAHAVHMLGSGVPVVDGFQWLNFTGASGNYVDFGDVLDWDGESGIQQFTIAMRFRNTGSTADQMLVQKGVNSVNAASFTGFFMALLKSGQIRVGVGNGSDTAVVSGGSYTDNGWHTVRLSFDFTGAVSMEVDGSLVGSDTLTGGTNLSNVTPLRWGTVSIGTQHHLSGDIERAVMVGSSLVDQDPFIQGFLAAETPEEVVIPEDFSFAGAWPVTDGFGTIVSDKSPDENHGTITGGAITWQPTMSTPPFLQDRYMRVDISQGPYDPDPFMAGRFALGRGLQVCPLYGTSTNTTREESTVLVSEGFTRHLVQGPKFDHKQWQFELTREDKEAIAYALLQERGSSRTVVAIDDMETDQPWTLQQGTLYGRISQSSPIVYQRGDRFSVSLDFEGL